jgi:hypothetical protein
MACGKKCVRITVAVVGVLLVMIGLLSMYAGLSSSTSPELIMLDLNKRVSNTLVFAGATMLVTAGIGWAAASTKSEPLSFFVRTFVANLLVRVHVNVRVFVVHSLRSVYFDCETHCCQSICNWMCFANRLGLGA